MTYKTQEGIWRQQVFLTTELTLGVCLFCLLEIDILETSRPDGMAEWVEHPSPVLGDQGSQTSRVLNPSRVKPMI